MLNEARLVRNWTEGSVNQTDTRRNPTCTSARMGRGGIGMETGSGRMEKGRCDAAVSPFWDANAFRFIAL